MFRIIVVIALILNLLICGFYIAQGLHDHFRYKAFQRTGFFINFEEFAIFFLIVSGAIFAIIGLFKVRWAAIISLLAGSCFFAMMTCYLISSFFDPMEQGRNGGALPFITICIGLLLLNITALVVILKNKPATH